MKGTDLIEDQPSPVIPLVRLLTFLHFSAINKTVNVKDSRPKSRDDFSRQPIRRGVYEVPDRPKWRDTTKVGFHLLLLLEGEAKGSCRGSRGWGD